MKCLLFAPSINASKKSDREPRSTTGVAGDANRIDISAGKTRKWDSRAKVALPDHRAGRGVERVNVIRFCDGNNHRSTGTPLDVERLRVNIAGNRAIKVEVARQASGSGRRKGGVDVHSVAGKIVVLLDHVDLRIDSRNHTPHDAGEK